MEKCKICKHYSCLIPIPSDKGECLICQAHQCIYCTNHGKNCKNYEFGENDGGKTLPEYEEEWDKEED